MSSLIVEAKRYQNPELFERLAMEYAIGIMHGGARKRFEALMEKHLYLRATTEAYEHQFARLAELLPEKQPNPRVWKQVEKRTHVKKSVAKEPDATPWWQSLQMKIVGFAVMLFFAVSALFVFLPSATTTVATEAYVAMLQSNQDVTMAMATAKKGEGIHVEMMDDVDVPEDMKLTLWCLPKKVGEKPMMMGAVEKSGESTIKIDKKAWVGLADVSAFAISMEPMEAKHVNGPEGKVLYQGDLQIMSKNS